MKTLAAAFLSAALGGCTIAPPMAPVDDLFHDALFDRPSVPIDPEAPLALSPRMQAYVAATLQKHGPDGDRVAALVEAMRHGDLHLDYDATVTRTAAEAFDARAGNCMALVLMTAAFARQLGLAVHYQSVLGEESWDHTDQLYIGIGHLNLRVEPAPDALRRTLSGQGSVVIDFLPPREAERLTTEPVEERTVLAMFMNNRAVESFTQAKVDDAYWWAREALRQDAALPSAYVTLAVIYRQRHHPEWSEAVLERVSRRYPDDLQAMSNRVLVLHDLHRDAEAQALAKRLAELDPAPPFADYRRGLAALRDGHPEQALRFFTKSADRGQSNAELEYWIAVCYSELADPANAGAHLARALAEATTRKDQALYAAKLERLKAVSTH